MIPHRLFANLIKNPYLRSDNFKSIMAKQKLSNSQIVCITLLWGILCYILLVYSNEITGETIFAIVASGIIVFVPIYKNIKRRGNNKS